MIASVYIKNGNIHLFNEGGSLTKIGGIADELGKPLLNFVCYEPERFNDAFTAIASAFDDEYAHVGAKDPLFIASMEEALAEMQRSEIYVYFYCQMFVEFIYEFIESPKHAILSLEDKLPGAKNKLNWVIDFEWPESYSPTVTAVLFQDKEKRLYRAAMDVVELLSEHFNALRAFAVNEIEVLLHYRERIEVPVGRSIDYIDILDEYHMETVGGNFYLEKPFRVLYGRVDTQEVELLHEIQCIQDLFRFEFIKMIEYDIFIKKCKNCERFFIPKRRADTEYCDRIFGETSRKCSEVGATLRYEKKVAGNPILDAHKKAYRRLNSRTRNKKMTQTEFITWADEAAKKRDACLTGELNFDEFVAWLEQGRVRKGRSSTTDVKQA